MKKESKIKINLISGDKIKYFRNLKGYTAEKVASCLAMQDRTYFYKSKGDTEFTATEIWMLTNILDCTLDDLIKDEHEMNNDEKAKFKELNSNHSAVDKIEDENSLKYNVNAVRDKKIASVESDTKFNLISGDKVKHFINLYGYSTDKIAFELGKKRRTYFNKIKGATEFTATEIWVLTKLFNCSINDLIKDFMEI